MKISGSNLDSYKPEKITSVASVTANGASSGIAEQTKSETFSSAASLTLTTAQKPSL